MARPTAVIWDMDGTLLDSAVVLPDAVIASVALAGGPSLTPDEVLAAYSVGPPEAILGHLLGRAASAEETEHFYGVLDATAPGRVRPFPGVPEALATLTVGTPQAVCTGNSRRAAQTLLGAAGLLGYFEVSVGGDEVARPKPQPDGLWETCARLGVTPSATVYVGDSPLDLEAARRGGLVAVAAGWGHFYREHSRPAADVVLAHPGEVLTLLDGGS